MIHIRYGTAEVILTPALEARGDGGTPSVNYEMSDMVMAVYMAIGVIRLPPADFAQGIINTALSHGHNPGGPTP